MIELLSIFAVASLVMVVSACSPRQGAVAGDPFERVNRGTHAFNKGLDRTILSPLSKTYTDVVPDPVENSVSNFASNLSLPGECCQQPVATGSILCNPQFGKVCAQQNCRPGRSVRSFQKNWAGGKRHGFWRNPTRMGRGRRGVFGTACFRTVKPARRVCALCRYASFGSGRSNSKAARFRVPHRV